jgi:hypothetical protein
VSFETTVPRSAKVSTLKGVEDIEYFDLRQTAKLIKERTELEAEYWKAIIRNDKSLIVDITDQIDRMNRRINRWETTKSDKVR